MKLISFGCSLVFGTDLADDGRDQPWPKPSRLTWPALIAEKLHMQYLCKAKGGSGNLCILNRVLESVHMQPQACFIINWSFIDRFDYSDPAGLHFNNGHNDYHTLRPSEKDDLSWYYFKHLHSEHKDKLTNLIYIKTAVDCLLNNKIPFLMTCIDDLLFCKSWHALPALIDLQEQIRPHICFFEGRNFLDWSRYRGFEISPSGHPLEQAHAQAAELMVPAIDAILRRA